MGNDLTSPHGRVAGRKPGDRWCVCARRWAQAFAAAKASAVILAATDVRVLDDDLEDPIAHALDVR